MKHYLSIVLLAFLALAVPAHATLDGLLGRLNKQAESDLAGFSARISAQFGIPEAQVKIVLSAVKKPADAFMVFQVGKMSGQPPERVLDSYQRGHGKGWGALAREMGIKPGSPEFHALKRGDFDLAGGPSGNAKGKGKDRDKRKGKKKHDE
jgi:hypothetical protein